MALTWFPVSAQAAEIEPQRLSRLVHLGRLWGTIRYLHPFLAYRDIDWDAALVQTIPRVRMAATSEEYAEAVEEMLQALSDPATSVLSTSQGPQKTIRNPSSASAPFQWATDKILIVNLRSITQDQPFLQQTLAQVADQIRKADSVILDLRGAPGTSFDEIFTSLNRLLTNRPIRVPAQRYLQHSGYRPQVYPTSGGYFSAFVTLPEEELRPSSKEHRNVAFVVTPESKLPSLALALQAAGEGIVISEGPLDDRGTVHRLTLDIGEGIEVAVRITEIIPRDGWPGIQADIEVTDSNGETDASIHQAVEVVASKIRPRTATPARAPPLPAAVWKPDKIYSEMHNPSLEYRLLAVFRFWNVIRYFYPYPDLIGDWDKMLPKFIAKMEAAKDGRDYSLALAEMAARVQDSHVDLWGHPELSHLFGEAFVPIALRWIDDAFTVTAVRKDSVVGPLDIRVGDEILEVDNQSLKERLTFFSQYVSASNSASLRSKIAPLLLGGAPNSTAVVTVQGANGVRRKVRIPRGAPWNPENTGPVVRKLRGHFGYVDLTRLTLAEVDDAFEKLRDTRGIIFDLRGYPRFTAWAVAARLNTGAKVGALFRRPLVSGIRNDQEQSMLCFKQPLPEPENWQYSAPTVALIDERTISQGEHAALLLEAAHSTRFVGTSTAGTNGDVTDMTLPGGIVVRFTGHGVSHADGRPLQRIGIVPDVKVAPSLGGLRAGQDEVLEAALYDLEERTRTPPTVDPLSPWSPGNSASYGR